MHRIVTMTIEMTDTEDQATGKVTGQVRLPCESVVVSLFTGHDSVQALVGPLLDRAEGEYQFDHHKKE